MKKSASNKFLFKDKKKFFSKLNFFVQEGKDKLHLLLDFDRTLTKSQNKSGENVSTWEILKNHLSQKSQKEYQQFYEKYRILEIENQMTTKDAVMWWEEILNIFEKNKLKLSDIKEDIEKKMPMRPYVKQLFETCERKNIPIIIISAGIKDVIEMWCQKFGINPTLILSTDLIFSKDGYMNGWHKKSLIHILNKKEKSHQEIQKIRLKRPNTILIGDSLDDASMVGGEAKVLRIIINDLWENNKNIGKFLDKFDLEIRDKTLLLPKKFLDLF